METLTKTEPRLDWMSVGIKYTKTEQARAMILAAAGSFEWLKVVRGLSLPMSQGMALNETIQQFKLPKVSHVGYDPALAPMSMIAVRNKFKDGICELFLVDDGCAVTPVLAKFYKN